ncbi:hypothetical protein DXZ75_05495 [Streptomyces sp. AcE210]|nr:hypothetical protein DXZ75_05495 [Streptomyces sp. AcE210]
MSVLKDGDSAAARQSVLEIFHCLGTTGEGIEQFQRDVLRGVFPDCRRPENALRLRPRCTRAR